MAYPQESVRKHGARVVAIAEPREDRRERAARNLNVSSRSCVPRWEDLPEGLCGGAHAAIVATPDRLHSGPALQFIELGVPVLFEKPIAPKEEEAKQIVDAAEDRDVLVCVPHVMRYGTYSRQLKAMVGAGAIGDVVSIEHLEPVGWWHFAHSYVRGNCRREGLSSSMLLSKSCHDIDWLSLIVGERARRVSSFGSYCTSLRRTSRWGLQGSALNVWSSRSAHTRRGGSTCRSSGVGVSGVRCSQC